MLANDRAWYLIARTISKEASESEKAELQSILQEDAGLQQHYSMLQEFWPVSVTDAAPSSQRLEEILRKAKKQEAKKPQVIAPKVRSISGRVVWMAAASLLTVIGIALFIFQKKDNRAAIAKSVVYTDSISTSNGNRSQLILPDGSRVWLNSGSRLLYQNFNQDSRQVRLIGEAYFEIVKMPSKPFIVHAERVNIRVLGTVFNVRCYPEEKNVETTLLHGAVSITHKDDPVKKVILLTPNQKITISKEFSKAVKLNEVPDSAYIVTKVDSTVRPSHLQETAWVYNRLEFKNIDFKTLAAKMERWYNVKIIFKDAAAQQLRFVGSFEKETVKEAMQALQSVAGFEFWIKDREVYIHSFK